MIQRETTMGNDWSLDPCDASSPLSIIPCGGNEQMKWLGWKSSSKQWLLSPEKVLTS
jgi:hypothetical protein